MTIFKSWQKIGINISPKNVLMDNKHRARWSTSFVIREMQIKIIMRYYFTPASHTHQDDMMMIIIMTIKMENNKCWQECEEIGIIYPQRNLTTNAHSNSNHNSQKVETKKATKQKIFIG